MKIHGKKFVEKNWICGLAVVSIAIRINLEHLIRLHFTVLTLLYLGVIRFYQTNMHRNHFLFKPHYNSLFSGYFQWRISLDRKFQVEVCTKLFCCLPQFHWNKFSLLLALVYDEESSDIMNACIFFFGFLNWRRSQNSSLRLNKRKNPMAFSTSSKPLI